MYRRKSRNRPSQIQPVDFCKDAKIVISISGVRKFGNTYAKIKIMNFALNFTPYTKITSKWIIDMNVKHKTINVLDKNRQESLFGLGLNRVLRFNTKSPVHKIKINKLAFINIKNFCSEDTLKKVKRETTDWRKHLKYL